MLLRLSRIAMHMNRTGKMITATFGIGLFYLTSVRSEKDIFSINTEDVVWIPKPMSSSEYCDNGKSSMYGFSLAIDSDSLFIGAPGCEMLYRCLNYRSCNPEDISGRIYSTHNPGKDNIGHNLVVL